MSGARVGGEMACRICGLQQPEPIWGADGQSPTYAICPCCGCEFGDDDCLPDAIQRRREKWVLEGTWFDPTKRPTTWNKDEQLKKLPRFYFRVLSGLPGIGPPAVSFNTTGTGKHAERFVVEFTCATGRRWVGNFEPGLYGASGVLAVPGRTDQALVLAEGEAYVVEPEAAALVRAFGGQITDVFTLADRDAVILGNGLWLECVGPEGLRWRTPRLSWDGMMEVAVYGQRLRGQAFNPIDDTWSPFEVDIDTGETTGGSYPPELQQP
jgi:hypothetical protein